jgi:hypothetical protein
MIYYLFDNINDNVQVGSGWIRIRISGLLIRGSGFERNIYKSTTRIKANTESFNAALIYAG